VQENKAGDMKVQKIHRKKVGAALSDNYKTDIRQVDTYWFEHLHGVNLCSLFVIHSEHFDVLNPSRLSCRLELQIRLAGIALSTQ
jgi:hypothetical protein